MASENKSGPESMEYLFTPHNLASLDFETPPACVQHWSSQVAQIITTMCKEAGDRADTTKKELEAQILAKEKIISDWKGIAEDRAKELALLHHTIKSREADVSRLKSQLAISQRNEDREKDENNRVVKAWKEEAELLTNKLRAKESLLNDIRNDYLRMKERADLEKREALDVDLAREIAGRMREVGEIYSRSKYLIEQVVKKESGCDEPNREDQVEDGTNERRQRKRRDEPRDPKSEQAAAPKKQRPCGVTRRHPKLPTRDGGNQNENSTRTSRWRPTYDNTPPIPGQAEPPRQSPEHAGPQDVNIKFVGFTSPMNLIKINNCRNYL